MAVSDVFFILFAAITLLSACVVVMSNRLTHAVFSLLFTFFGVAGIYVFLGADFVAAAQVIVYVGGILVLLLFGVMLTTRIYDLNMLAERVHFGPSLLVTVLGFILLVYVIGQTAWPLVEAKAMDPTTKQIGHQLMTEYLLPFEVAAVLLLAALIGAASLASRDDEDAEEGEA